MPDTIALDFSYTKQDCVRAWRSHYHRRLRLPLDAAAIFLLGASGIWDWYSNGPRLLTIVALTAACVLALMIIFAFYVIPNMVWMRDRKLRQPYSLRFSERNISFHIEGLDSSLDWGFYTSAQSDSHSYLLYYGRNAFTVIPKRVFLSAGARQDFEELLRQKIGTVLSR